MNSIIAFTCCLWLTLFSTAITAQTASVATQSTEIARDEAESKAVIKQAATDSGKVADQDKAEKAWIPSAIDYDWVQLVSNEWLKGEIKAMYKDNLEFDSDKLDLLNIDWEDVKILRSYRHSSINIDGIGHVYGVLEVTDDAVRISNDYEDKTYHRERLISFAPGGENEKDLWSVKAVLGTDLRNGNTDQLDFNTRVNIKRRASLTRFILDYIGNISKTSGADSGSLVETVNNHRVSGNFDYYKTRHFYYIPAFFEFYKDRFTNINLKSTFGVGAGYTLIDDGVTELSIGGGPAYVKTDFYSVAPGEDESVSTAAAVVRTNYETEVTDTIDFIAKYNIQLGNQASGGYTHHIILTMESEITGSLDLDVSFIWDRTSNPAEASDGTRPFPDDFRLTLGLSYTY